MNFFTMKTKNDVQNNEITSFNSRDSKEIKFEHRQFVFFMVARTKKNNKKVDHLKKIMLVIYSFFFRDA